MVPEETVRRIAARVPQRLRAMRAKMMLEECCESLGVPECACPACDATGWLNRRTLEACPLCVSFQQVPGPLADWFCNELGTARAPRRPPGEHTLVPEKLWRARAERDVRSARPERLGRAALHVAHVHLDK